MRASRASVGPRSSGEVARQYASARSNQRFVNSFLCLNLFFAERQSYVHSCGFNTPVQRRRAQPIHTLGFPASLAVSFSAPGTGTSLSDVCQSPSG